MEKATRRIICVHTCAGKKHDYRLFKDSRVRMNSQITAIFDSGYQGIQKEHINTLLPLKKTKGAQLSKEQKRFNQCVAQQRIVNENVIGSLKRFQIIAQRYRNRRKRYSLRVTLIAAIHNFEISEV